MCHNLLVVFTGLFQKFRVINKIIQEAAAKIVAELRVITQRHMITRNGNDTIFIVRIIGP